MDVADVEDVWRDDDIHHPRTAVLSLENTHNFGGGTVWSVAQVEDVAAAAREAGMEIGQLLRLFAPKGWLPPVMPGTGFATVGGGIAMDVHGKNHHGIGSFGCHVEAMTLMTPEGPKRITPGRNKELFRATVGGLGQTGPILSAAIKLLKAKGDVMVVTERRIRNWDQFLERFEASDSTYSVGWIDATATGAALGRGLAVNLKLHSLLYLLPVLTLLDEHHGPRATLVALILSGLLVVAPFVLNDNVSLANYPRVQAWLAQIEGLPGFVPMARSAVGLQSA